MPDQITVGNVQILGLIDMVPPPYDPAEFFPEVPEEAWEPYKADHLENGQLQLYYVCFAIRSNGRVIMVDTGMGPGPHPSRDNRYGDLLNQLKLHGIAPEDVSTVVHTHLHHDHVGWNVTMQEGVPKATFPKAQYLVPRDDWEYFTNPSVLETAPYVKDNVMPLQALGVMELIEGEHTITPEITTVATPGHTPGHINVLISSGGQKGAIVGDVLHSKVQVQESGWCSRADVEPELGLKSRRDMLDRFERDGFIVAAGHFKPDEHFGRVVRLEGHRYWQVA